MRRSLPLTAASLVAILLMAGAARADEANEARLRDALRQAITQTRSMEDELARLRAKSAADDTVIEVLKAQSSKAAPAAPDKAILERMEAEANRRITAQNEALSKAGETLEKWKAAYEQAVNVAQAKEAERAKLAKAAEGLAKQSEACEAKNEALFKAAGEVLDHLKDISVAEAIAAHEPFVGTKRIELQNLAQDDEDKLLVQRISDRSPAP